MLVLRPGKRRDVMRTKPRNVTVEDVKLIGQRRPTTLAVGWTVGLRLSGEKQPGPY
jgi:hypothetical protein